MGILDANELFKVYRSDGASQLDLSLFVYTRGSDNLCPIYENPALTHQAGNPTRAGEEGMFDLCYLPEGDYRMVIASSRGDVLVDQDPVRIGRGLEDEFLSYFRSVAELVSDISLSYHAGQGKVVIAPGNTLHVVDHRFRYSVLPSDSANAHLSTTGGIKLKVDGPIYLDAFNPAADGTSDDTAAFQAAVDAASCSKTLEVFVSPGTYLINNGVLKSGIKLRGAGYQRQVGGDINGVIFTRDQNVPILTAAGTSILAGGPGIVNCEIEGIMFDGSGFSADIMDLRAFYTGLILCCMFTNTMGRWIGMTEVWDSRLVECRFEWGGTADGSVPGIEMISGGGYEATTQIFFESCVFESFRGAAIRTTKHPGEFRTNEVYFTTTKVESRITDTVSLDFAECTSIHFNLLQLAVGGTPGATNGALVQFRNSGRVSGVVHAELIQDGAEWEAYVDVQGASEIDLALKAYGRSISGASAIKHDGNNANHIRITMLGRTTAPATYPAGVGHMLSRDGAVKIEASPNAEASVGFLDPVRVPGESWDLGRVVPDGSGSKFRLLHNGTPVIEVLNNDVLLMRGGARAQAPVQAMTYEVAVLPNPAYWSGGIVFVSNESGGATLAFSDGANWRRVSDRTVVS